MSVRRVAATAAEGLRGGTARSLVGSVSSMLVVQGALVVTGVLTARMLGVENRGHLALMLIFPPVLTQVGSLGIPGAVTFFLAREPGSAPSMVRRLAALAATQAAILLVADYWILHSLFSGSLAAAARLTLPLVPAQLAQQYGLAVLQGQSRFTAFNTLRTVPMLLYAPAVALVFILGDGSVAANALAWSGAYVAAGCATCAVVSRGLSAATTGTGPELRRVVSFGMRGMIGWASPVEGFRLDQQILGLFVSARALGLYVVGQSLTNLPMLMSMSIGWIAYPRISAERDARKARRLLWIFVGLSGAVSLLVCAVLWVACGFLVPLFFGHAFAGAVSVARILLVSAVFLSVRRVVAEGARGIGLPGLASVAEIALWLVLAPLAVLLGDRYGAPGVALALVAGSAASLAVVAFGVAAARYLKFFREARRRAIEATRRGAVPVLGASLVATAVGAATARVGSLPTPELLIAAIGCTVAVPLAVRLLQRSFDIFEPTVVFAVVWTLIFVVRPTAMLAEHNFSLSSWSSDIVDVSSTYTLALKLGLLGAAAFVVGYALPVGRGLGQRTRSLPTPDGRLLATGAFVAGAVGAAFFALFFASNGGSAALHTLLAGRGAALHADVSNASVYSWQGPYLFVPSALILLVVGRSLRSLPVRLAGYAAVGLLLLRALPTGQRGLLLPFVGSFFVYSYLRRDRRPSVLTFALVAFAALIASAVLTSSRTASTSGSQPSVVSVATHGISHPSSLFAPVITGGDGNEFPAFAAALQLIPGRIGYMHGKAALGDLLTRPIPHKFWPTKPLPPRERVIQTLWPREFANGQANPEFSPLLIFYLDFGALGIAIGMIVYGVAARALWEYLRRNRSSLMAQLVFATALPAMVGAFRDGFADTALNLIWLVVPVWIIFRWASAAERRYAREVGPAAPLPGAAR